MNNSPLANRMKDWLKYPDSVTQHHIDVQTCMVMYVQIESQLRSPIRKIEERVIACLHLSSNIVMFLIIFNIKQESNGSKKEAKYVKTKYGGKQ